MTIPFLFFTEMSYAGQPPASSKSWTFLIFMNGDDEFMDEDQEEIIESMETIGSSEQINVVVQYASLRTKNSIRLLVQKSNNPHQITSPVLQQLGYVDMGDYHNLQNFIDWGIENFPAQHYAIVIASHGSGWYDSSDHSEVKSSRKRIISPDVISENQITIPQLSEVLRHTSQMIGHKIDIYGSDACLMQDIETLTELADTAHLIIGSEDLEHYDGGTWPYDLLFAKMEKISNPTPEQVSKLFIDSVKEMHERPIYKDEVSTFSVIDPERLQVLNKAIQNLSFNMLGIKKTEDVQKIVQAQEDTLHFTSPSGDLLEFIQKLRAANVEGLDKKNLTEIEDAINQAVIYKFNNTPRYQNLGGIGIWQPPLRSIFPNAMKNYHDLKFDRDTKWGAILEYLLSALSVEGTIAK
jgi:hypothetical protein